jgi:subtilisin family serine protease
VYDSALAGASGRFGPAQMAAIEACLGDGALAFAEPDGGVVKQERGTARRWWEAARAAAAAGDEEKASDVGDGDAGSGRVEAFDAAASGGGEPARVRRSQDDAQRLLAAVGREAQRELSRAPLITEEAASPRLQATDGGESSQQQQQQRLPAALWSLDRIDQRALPRDGLFSLGAGGGEGVTIYSVDSGVYFAHQEFLDFATGERRASSGPDFVDSDADASDCDGHGTHTAATAAGRSTGVAKRAKVVAVRVLDCDGSGSIANTVAGLDWCVCDAFGPRAAAGKGRPAAAPARCLPAIIVQYMYCSY